jgi:hypothetical protein
MTVSNYKWPSGPGVKCTYIGGAGLRAEKMILGMEWYWWIVALALLAVGLIGSRDTRHYGKDATRHTFRGYFDLLGRWIDGG